MSFFHGGDIYTASNLLTCRPRDIIDFSASTVPFPLPIFLRASLPFHDISSYPDPKYTRLVNSISNLHSISPEFIIPGNGASELITWCGKESKLLGTSLLLQPAYSDYERALRLWECPFFNHELPLDWSSSYFDTPPNLPPTDVIWITNPHNPTGRLWRPKDLYNFLSHYRLVIVDESFLPFVHKGEDLSFIHLVPNYSNLIVIRSLTKVFGLAGLRIGYAITQPHRLSQWRIWRDPWPLNTYAYYLASNLLNDISYYHNWISSLQTWASREHTNFELSIRDITALQCMPSSANFCLLKGTHSLATLRNYLLHSHRVLVRDCSSFMGLDDSWIRISYKTLKLNSKLLLLLKSYFA